MSSTGRRGSGAGGTSARAGRVKPQPRAQATRQAILTAAAEHFARNGYHATSLDSVLADSGGTKGALYFHFASKDALARAVVAEMVQGWRDLRRQVSNGLDPLSTLLVLVDEVIARLLNDPIARGGTRLLNDLPVAEEQARAHYGFGEQEALDLLTQAAHAGLLREGIDPAVAARQFIAIVAGHRLICDALGQHHHLRRRVEQALDLLLPAIATDSWLVAWRVSTPLHPPRHEDISGSEGKEKGPRRHGGNATPGP